MGLKIYKRYSYRKEQTVYRVSFGGLGWQRRVVLDEDFNLLESNVKEDDTVTEEEMAERAREAAEVYEEVGKPPR